jgi:membrane protein YqaA with SNARE-associated domain
MDRLSDFFDRIISFITPLAEHYGAPGLAVVALLDSSFLSLPQVGDALLIGLTIRHPSNAFYYAAATTLGSVAGCYALYAVGRKSGEAFLRRKFHERHIDRGLELFKRHGWLTIAVPSLLPPPTPFKLFVLLSGVADLKPGTFLMAVALGRGFRYGVEAWLAYAYGERALEFARSNLPVVSAVLAGVILAGALGLAWWRRRRRGRTPVAPL